VFNNSDAEKQRSISGAAEFPQVTSAEAEKR
jgi:hypothetical protein